MFCLIFNTRLALRVRLVVNSISIQKLVTTKTQIPGLTCRHSLQGIKKI